MPSLKVSSVNKDGNNVKHQSEHVSLLGYEALQIEDIDCAGDVESDDYTGIPRINEGIIVAFNEAYVRERKRDFIGMWPLISTQP